MLLSSITPARLSSTFAASTVSPLILAAVSVIVPLTTATKPTDPTLVSAQAGTSSVATNADAYVNSAAPNQNHGNSSRLIAKASSAEFYLNFTVPQAPSGYTWSSAKLVVNRPQSDSAGVLTANKVTSSWTEQGVTWNTRPTFQSTQVSINDSGTTPSVSIDVTPLLSTGTLGFVVRSGASTSKAFSSRESGRAANLVLTKVALPTATSTATTTATSTATSTATTTISPTPTATSTASTTTAPTPTSPTPTATTTTSPTPTATSTATTTTSPVCVTTTKGIPCSPYVGASVGSNSDPSTFESTVSGNLGVRRTFWGPTQVDSAINTVKADKAKGRLSWISFKLPYTWADMAAGAGDAWAKDLATKLAALDYPVWVAFHHEPEGDGDIAQWVAMQRRLSPIVRTTAPKVAFTTILTGWHELYDPNYSLDKMWPGDGLVDVVGFDIYLSYGVVKDGVMNTKYTDLDSAYFAKIQDWAAKHNVKWGLAETGITDYASDTYSTWMPEMVSKLKARGGVAWSYFNTSLNSAGSWVITTQNKTTQFSNALKQTARTT